MYIYIAHYSLIVSAEAKVKNYENKILRLSLQYPDNWTINAYDRPTCLKFDACYIIFRLTTVTNETVISIRVQDLHSIGLFACNCQTLSDYVDWNYNWNDNYKKANLISDNQTTVGKDPLGWQAEISKNQKNSKSLVVFYIDGTLGYSFDYSTSNESSYVKYLSDFRDMLKSIEFRTNQ